MIEQALMQLSNAVTLFEKPVVTGIKGVAIDTRLLKPGELFIALPTEIRDGHDFIGVAVERGAKALLVSRDATDLPPIPNDIWIIQVPDTYLALRELGIWFRKNVLKVPVVALTGSYAKTTVRTFATEILKELGDGLITSGNYNNLLGVPLTLMVAKPVHNFGLFELGMNRYNEIAELTKMCEPDFGLITHIGRAHLEFFGSEWGVAQAKGELFAEMKPTAMRLVNLDDPFIRDLAVQYPGTNDIGYTLEGDNHGFHGEVIHARAISPDEKGRFGIRIGETSIRSPLPGRHHCENLIAAAVIGIAMEIPLMRIAERISLLREVPMRGQVLNIGGVQLIRDEYNASLHSMAAALELLADLPNVRRRIAVLGDIFELGKWARLDHEMLADIIVKKNINAVYLTGEMCRYTLEKLIDEDVRNVFYFEEVDSLIEQLLLTVAPEDAVLVKGSRGMKLERVSEALIAFMREKENA